MWADDWLTTFLYKHSQRSNVWRWCALGGFCFYLGQVLYYVNYKISVVEPKWVGDYGQDVPHFRKLWLANKVQIFRAKYIHFYIYKVRRFIEEQVIDPLNDNSLSSKNFDVYQFKRLIRAIKYDEIRDSSFDFMSFGEDDIEEYDDFV